ncbi:hypothetical protein [Nitrosomonas sp. Is37]|uniref:hypothetical protein n=1 Tax=Nitrosomonas sp. Is37 TaxID=3080535 RepID=UPI00294AD712|nr:hypothetical protein [Nitrosomonas sp. Is37]MDV6343606.1 hypothetical protein [Nitrosomonas sp. Is37]
MSEFGGFLETLKYARTLKNPCEPAREGKKTNRMKGWFLVLVEAAGIEPSVISNKSII